MENELIYLDYCATTPVHPQALQDMLPFFNEHFGNASSIYHKWGRKAAEAIDDARNQVADAIHASTKEIIFTSGATEAINQALKGIWTHYHTLGKHIITCTTEHPAVLDTCKYLENQGATITYLPVDQQGNISLDDLENAIRADTILIALMLANNETGVIHPVKAVGELARKHRILFFCDATQAIGKIPVNVEELNIDLMAISAHKCYGPKGIGALYIRRRSTPIQVGSLLNGGKQENKLRAGTLNVPAIVGFGTAIHLTQQLLVEKAREIEKLRNDLEGQLLTIPESFVNGIQASRLPHVSNIGFKYVKSAELMGCLPRLALSSGSACATGSLDPSHVLLAMGMETNDAHSCIRISLGNPTTKQELIEASQLIRQAVEKLRSDSPIWQMHEAGLL